MQPDAGNYVIGDEEEEVVGDGICYDDSTTIKTPCD
jgi:hypothetical protein